MNIYELKSDIRRKVTLCIALISLFLGCFLYELSIKLYIYIVTYIPAIDTFFSKWEFLGALPSQITVVAVYSAIRSAFNKHMWKWPCINKHLNVPNLNGVWEGCLESSHIKDGAHVNLKMDLFIEQTWEKMTCTSIFPSSKSFSDIVCIDSSSSHGTLLKFTYVNHSEDLDSGLTQFAGYNELRLNDANTLEGTYYTKREPMTRGTILLIRRDPKDIINQPANPT